MNKVFRCEHCGNTLGEVSKRVGCSVDLYNDAKDGFRARSVTSAKVECPVCGKTTWWAMTKTTWRFFNENPRFGGFE